jgi:AcrR family transcriptional regulator
VSAAAEQPVTYPTAARELLRNTLLDAAGRQLASQPWSEITMSAIATAAGVSRQTLYNEFGSRSEFAQALALRETSRFIDAVQSTIAANAHDPRIALQATFELFLTVAAENPLVSAIVSGSGADELIALFTTRGETLVETASTRLSELLCATWTTAPPQQVAVLGECLVRLAISYAALPKTAPDQTAEAVASLLGPYVEELISARA